MTGTFYRIVTTADGVMGEFDSVSPNFEIEYRNNHSEIWARYVPEPTAVSLVPLSACLLRRRRSAAR
jgi:hypothetical protein